VKDFYGSSMKIDQSSNLNKNKLGNCNRGKKVLVGYAGPHVSELLSWTILDLVHV